MAEWLAVVLDERKALKYRDTKTERVMLRTHVERDPLGALLVAEVEGPEARAWWRRMLGKGLSWSTLRNVLSFVRVGLQVAVSEGVREGNPFRELAVPRSLKQTTQGAFEGVLTGEEQARLVQAGLALCKEGRARERDVAMMRVALGAGLRRAELLSLRWEDVHMGDDPHITVRYGAEARATKGGKPRVVPLFGDALQALRDWGEGDAGPRVFPGARGKRMRDIPRATLRATLVRAGVTRRVRWHDLRHSCATVLLEGERGRAWSTVEVQQLLGHRSVAMTEKYIHAQGALLRRAAREHREKQRDTIPAPPPDCEPLRGLLRVSGRLARGMLDTQLSLPLGLETPEQHRAGRGSSGATDSSPVHPADIPSPPAKSEAGAVGAAAEAIRGQASSVARALVSEVQAEVATSLEELAEEVEGLEAKSDAAVWDRYVLAWARARPSETAFDHVANAAIAFADRMLSARRARFGGSR